MPLAGITALLLEFRYLILFPLACLEGPITAFVVGMLVAAGYFNPVVAYIIFIFGDVIPDTVYYALGRYGGRYDFVARNAAKLGIATRESSVVRALWHDHSAKTMLLSKFAYGLSTPLLISAGLVHMPFRRFLVYSFLISLGQYAVLMTLGYYFSSSFGLVSTTLERVGIGITAAILFAFMYYLFAKYMRSKVFLAEREEKSHEEPTRL
jgi:membrane protein DedA with SNARE-associated domain